MIERSKNAMSLAFALTLWTGCASNQGILDVDRCADVPAGAIPEPAGNKLCQWQTSMVQNAAQDRNAFYMSDFVGASAELSPNAIDRLSRMIQHQSLGGVLVVEPSGDLTLDQARVSSLGNAIASTGQTPPSIQIASPVALGLSGPLAERAARNFGGSQLGQNRSAQNTFGNTTSPLSF